MIHALLLDALFLATLAVGAYIPRLWSWATPTPQVETPKMNPVVCPPAENERGLWP